MHIDIKKKREKKREKRDATIHVNAEFDGLPMKYKFLFPKYPPYSPKAENGRHIVGDFRLGSGLVVFR